MKEVRHFVCRLVVLAAWAALRDERSLLSLAARGRGAMDQGKVATTVRRILLVGLAIGLAVNLVSADDTAFRGVKVTDAKGQQTDANLVFNDSNQAMVVRVADHDFVTIPYDQMDKVSYEYTKKHRVTQGAIVMVASVGAGAIVMLTKSKSHWLYVDYHEQNAPKTVVLRMDKGEYHRILEAVKLHTGKEVQLLGDAAAKKGKRDK